MPPSCLLCATTTHRVADRIDADVWGIGVASQPAGSSGPEARSHHAAAPIMSKPGLLVVGVMLVLLGALFTLQGFDVVQGSAISGSAFWAVAGPVIVVAGLATARIGVRGRLR